MIFAAPYSVFVANCCRCRLRIECSQAHPFVSFSSSSSFCSSDDPLLPSGKLSSSDVLWFVVECFPEVILRLDPAKLASLGEEHQPKALASLDSSLDSSSPFSVHAAAFCLCSLLQYYCPCLHASTLLYTATAYFCISRLFLNFSGSNILVEGAQMTLKLHQAKPWLGSGPHFSAQIAGWPDCSTARNHSG